MPAIKISDLNNAKRDVDHIAEVATSMAPTATDRLGGVKLTVKAAMDSLKAFNSRGAWATATVYELKDIVTSGGLWYVCVAAHVSAADFATDAATKWRIHQGITAEELAVEGGAEKVGFGDRTVAVALGDLEDLTARLDAGALRQRTSRPAFIEQHISGFFGRGMLAAETINQPTEQALVGAFATGAATLQVTDATYFLIGGCVTVKHDNGLYGTYFVDSKAGSNIGIRPGLRYDCLTAAARIERTWFNRAHPGKFYMRSLAQRIARSTELDAAMPNGRRALYTNVSSNPNTPEDTLAPIGSATVAYYAFDNLGETGTTASPVRFTFGRSAYVENILANSDGVETPLFDVSGVANAVVKFMFLARTTTTTFSAQVFDELNVERGKFVIPSGANHGVLREWAFPSDLRGAKQIKVRIACEFYAAPGGYFTVPQIDVFEAPPQASKIIANPAAKIVCLGDSWMQGDLGSTPEREPIPTQLALELPYATIINAGVGGNKIWQELDRFDTDVAPHNPDYVVVNTGTNECYSPSSGVFDPNSIGDFMYYYHRLLNKIAAIGARPIIIGVPALAQTDADAPTLAEWLLNDRARSYARYFFEGMSEKPVLTHGSGANGSWTKFSDGTMIARHTVSVTTVAANTIASTLWTFPIAFQGIPHVTGAPSGFNTNQLLSAGSTGATTLTVSIRMVSGAGALTMPIDCIAVGRWR